MRLGMAGTKNFVCERKVKENGKSKEGSGN